MMAYPALAEAQADAGLLRLVPRQKGLPASPAGHIRYAMKGTPKPAFPIREGLHSAPVRGFPPWSSLPEAAGQPRGADARQPGRAENRFDHRHSRHRQSIGSPRSSRRMLLHHLKKLVFAVETPLAVIADIFRPVHFAVWMTSMAILCSRGESQCVLKLGAGQTGRICDHGQHVTPQYLVRHPGQISGIDAARVRHQRAARAHEAILQGVAVWRTNP